MPDRLLKWPVTAVATSAAAAFGGYHRRKTLQCAMIALVLASTLADSAADTGSQDLLAMPDSQAYLVSTPQISDPMRPLAHAHIAADQMTVHAAVFTVADPLETRLARMFDIQLSSLMRAFHAKGYELDAFALTWNPRLSAGSERGKRLPENGTRNFENNQRSVPGVLVFRRDIWRLPEGKETVGVDYVVLFLVGESPTFGVQPKAFASAASCAIALNGLRKSKAPDQALMAACNASDAAGKPEGGALEVVGPTFSGSMQSLALAVGTLLRDNDLTVQVTSPSATVKSNNKVADWVMQLSGKDYSYNTHAVSYQRLAASLEEQLLRLCEIPVLKDDDIVILAEESAFGSGVSEILRSWCKPETSNCKCAMRIRVAQFPQNVASIRAEHSRINQKTSQAIRQLTKSKGRLLELDLSKMDQTTDRPPSYSQALSARSDELMLYGTFDAIKVWVDPAAVAIVATDVRDRLFLLNEVRKNLPRALPVLMEIDFLTAHPDYRKISRGAVVIPNAETLLMLDMDNGYCALPGQPRCHIESPNSKGFKKLNVAYYSFPSDYSANIFRASLGLVSSFGDTTAARNGDCLCELEPPEKTDPLVTTLAGFQKLYVEPKARKKSEAGSQTMPGSFGKLFYEAWHVVNGKGFKNPGPPGSKLLAADSRLSLQGPAYCFLFACGLLFVGGAISLVIHRDGDAIMMRPFSRGGNTGQTPTDDARSNSMDGNTPLASRAPWILMSIAAGILIIAVLRLVPILFAHTRFLAWDLPHGRDEWALISVFLLYVAIAMVGLWRLFLWRRRYAAFHGAAVAELRLLDKERLAPQGTSALVTQWWFIAAAGLSLVVIAAIIRPPVSVDPLTLPGAISLLLLTGGTWFLFEFRRQWLNWMQFATVLGKTMEPVSQKTTKTESTGKGGWPSPFALGELPQSPFSLEFRSRDLDALRAYPDDDWVADARQLMEGKDWPFGNGNRAQFARWQARLAAEMRFAAAAVRSCALCAVLAPTFVLISMSIYPAPWERFQTVVSVALIAVSFLLVIYAVLQLERHPLLGRLFTLHGDRISLGGALNTLWPKLVAGVIILTPVFFPNFLDWAYNVLRSINSLQ